MHPSRKAQIAYLKADKVLIKVFSKYADFANVCSPKLAAKLPEYMKINNHIIKLVNNQQPSYSSIYNMGLVELEMLKTYIKINMTKDFI